MVLISIAAIMPTDRQEAHYSLICYCVLNSCINIIVYHFSVGGF